MTKKEKPIKIISKELCSCGHTRCDHNGNEIETSGGECTRCYCGEFTPAVTFTHKREEGKHE